MAKKRDLPKTSKVWLSQVWWVPIIVALIGLGAAAIPLITKQKVPTPVETIPLQTFQYSVKVQAKKTGEDIPNAKLIIEVAEQAPLDEITDINGFTRVFIDANRAGQPARLIVQATGYQKYTQNIDLLKNTLPDIIQLESVPSTTTPTPTSTPLPPQNTPKPPTPTHTPIPTATPTVTSTPTVTPTVTPTPCPFPFGDLLFQQWEKELGCPTGQLKVVRGGAEQLMQGGHLFWRKDTDELYAIMDRHKQTGEDLFSGQWILFPDLSVAGDCLVETVPPPGTPPMVSGFSWWWCKFAAGPDGPFGWPVEREKEGTFITQPFINGLAWRGSEQKVFALLNSGRFLASSTTVLPINTPVVEPTLPGPDATITTENVTPSSTTIPSDKGMIILQGSQSHKGLKTQVQWLDNNDGWNNVENWYGPLDNTGRISWLVQPQDFNTGPFRWVVYNQDSSIKFISPPFNLPGAGQGYLINLN